MERIACLACDLLMPAPRRLEAGERAACPRCGHHLAASGDGAFQRSMALAVASVVLLALGLSFPFLSMSAKGLGNTMTLPGSALELYRNGQAIVALLVAAFTIFVPAAIVATVLALTVPLSRGHAAPWLRSAGRLLFALTPWSMVEVFVIGVIVSLVKLMAMASVSLGLSFWAYAAFALCLTGALSNLDRAAVWDAIEALEG